MMVPTNLISIGVDSGSGHRLLRFTHITWDAGPGPFRIDPAYNAATGTASFTQVIYRESSPGVWAADHRVGLGTVGTFESPSDYRFPLTSFVLYHVDAQNHPTTAAATSPKSDYCITADALVGGVPNTPPASFIPSSNCDDPTRPLGWSVGWGDQYDQTDDGQPIDLTNVADGTYLLRGTVDPQHLLTETNRTNNATDTLLRIAGTSVSVLGQSSPVITPPTVSLTAPASGARVSTAVTLQATAAAHAPAVVKSVQYLLDGRPLGPALTQAPYSYRWTVGSTAAGAHLLSARVVDSAGQLGTAPTVAVTVLRRIGNFTIEAQVSRTGSSAVTSPAFSASASDVLVALVGSDGPASGQAVTISGAGLRWTRVRRAATQPGDAEIWTATTPTALGSIAVTSTPHDPGYDQFLTVLALRGARGIGAANIAGGATGTPSITLTATSAGSWPLAVGNDWDHATARVPGSGQSLLSQYVDTNTGDTYWTQATRSVTTAGGQRIVLNDTSPSGDHWNLAAIEMVPTIANAAADTAAPTAALTNPTATQTVSGTVPVAADVWDDVGIRSAQFLLDGKPLGAPVTAGPFAVRWDTTTARPGAHALSVRVADGAGNVSVAARQIVTVQNPAPPMTCFVLQAQQTGAGRGVARVSGLNTAMPGEYLYAFVSSDGPAGRGTQATTVRGANASWQLIRRANTQAGVSEVWQARAPRILSDATVRSTAVIPGYQQTLTVIAMGGTDGIGAAVSASGIKSRPLTRLRTTASTSLVFAVGNEASEPGGDDPPAGWVRLAEPVGPSPAFWSQYTNQPMPAAGDVVTVSRQRSAGGSWDLVAVEIRGDD